MKSMVQLFIQQVCTHDNPVRGDSLSKFRRLANFNWPPFWIGLSYSLAVCDILVLLSKPIKRVTAR